MVEGEFIVKDIYGQEEIEEFSQGQDHIDTKWRDDWGELVNISNTDNPEIFGFEIL